MDLGSLQNRAASRDLIGVIGDIPNEVYRAAPGTSRSDLDYVDQSLAHYLHFKETGIKATAKMAEGTWFHTLLLEPHRVEKEWVLIEEGVNWGTKAYLEIQKGNEGKTCVAQDVFARLMKMRANALRKPRVVQYLEGFKELSAWATDPATGLLCKVRPDIYQSDLRFLIDLKTTGDASPKEFARSVANFGYHRQAAYYLDIFNHATRQEAKRKFGTDPGDAVDSFIFVAVENVEPYDCAIYVLGYEELQLGRTLYQRDLAALAAAQGAGVYPGYSDEIATLTLPSYAFY